MTSEPVTRRHSKAPINRGRECLLEDFQRAVDEFDITSSRLTIEPAALAAGRQSLDQSGLLLLGEVHGVRQNPLLARALMAALEVTGLALEWPAELAAAVSGFFADGRVPDHPHLWGGDGRITAGHFALLRERFLAGRLQALTLFDGVNETGWSQSESAMAERILNAQGPGARTLVVAGNAHTALTPTMLGVPLGARLAEWRPGVREIHIRYGNGTYYNLLAAAVQRPALASAHGPAAGRGRMRCVLDLPAPAQAWVPHRTAADAAAGEAEPGRVHRGLRRPSRPAPPGAARAGRRAGVPRLPRLPAPGGPAGARRVRRRRQPPRRFRAASRAVGPATGTT